jgi:hypothetical protein
VGSVLDMSTDIASRAREIAAAVGTYRCEQCETRGTGSADLMRRLSAHHVASTGHVVTTARGYDRTVIS